MLRKHRALVAGIVLLGAATSAESAVVISQVYGGGGGTSATYKNDFVELFNAGSTSVNLAGLTVQYASATGTGNFAVAATPTATLAPGKYFLIQLASSGTPGLDLPTPDATGTTNMSASGGKVVLVNGTSALACNGGNNVCSAAQLAQIVDLVGFGGANFFEGTGAAPAPSNILSDQRKGAGCTETNNNANDFLAATPSPRNSAASANSCGVTLSIADATVAEGNSGTTALSFTVSLSGAAPAGGVSFVATTGGGTATAGADYSALSSAPFSITEGTTSTTVTVNVDGDTLFELDENLTVTLSSVVGATALDTQATGQITNDDSAPAISIGDATVTEGNAGQAIATFTVSLSAASGLATTFTAVTADDTALASELDYANTTAGGEIPAGSTSTTVEVLVNGDTTVEPTETFFVNLTNLANATAGDAQGLGTITNDDESVVPVLSINNTSVIEGNSGTADATFTVTSSMAAPAGGIQVTATTSDGTATTADNDYAARSATVTILEGQTSATFAVSVNGDTKIESGETFTVELSNPSGSATISGGQGTATITNDDVAPNLSIDDASVTEGHSGQAQLVFPITLSGPAPQGGVGFTVTTTDGTATTADGDYAAQSGVAGTIAEGQNSGQVIVAVNGDARFEPNETFTVTLAAATNATLADATATGTISNDDYLEIHDIQGDNAATPFNNQVVATSGNIVTGIGPAGFTMQAPDARADSNINTSEAIYVYTVTTPAVAIGDRVDVSATATEFNGLTELTFATVTVTGNAQPLPTPVDFDASRPSSNPALPSCPTSGSNFECFEFMRVRVADGLVSTGNQRFANPPTETFAEVFITANGRRGVRDPGLLFPLLTTAGNTLAGEWDGNPELFELDADYFGAVPNGTPIYGGTRFNAVGVLGYDFGDYELWATEFNVTAASTIPRPVRDSAGAAELRIGAFNMLRYCDTTNSAGSGSDPCVSPTPTQAVFDAKVARLSRYVADVLKLPDVLGVEEVENLAVLQALATRLTTDTGVPYTARLEEGNDVGGIDVGFLVRTDRVTINTVTQVGKTTTWNDPTGSATALLNDRPLLLLEASFTGNGGMPFAVMVVHPKARSCTDQTGGASCQQGDVDRNRLKRFTQAQYAAQQIQQFQTAHPNVPFAVVGDFNAYQFTDGWADVVGLMAGTYDDAANLLDLGANIVMPSLYNAVNSLPANEQYSFLFTENFGQFQGFNTRDVPTLQVLDIALLNSAAKAMFTGFEFGRANQDAPNEIERQCGLVPTPAPPACPHPAIGVSDHDGFVFTLATDRIFRNGFEASP
ncbi:Calx-beta domain-containing protein [Tahibacter amnicola]|uniref:Lamin tail domain-containing protein n=1 Tax=Tahibacter amnicola TaxID=2976241 RepID=A0ABY6BDB1_9GAMM|nr:Calx-beta domain-containing protein [Tahibacter amnicola]UXI67213.1 lamin tail domain-containing protein [Tahibacter amnicola]